VGDESILQVDDCQVAGEIRCIVALSDFKLRKERVDMRRGSFFWGSILVLIGLIYLLDTMGVFRNLNINIWSLIWPIILIAFGLWMLFGTVLRGSTKTEHVNISLEGASSARLRLVHGAGRLRINAGAGPGDLVEGDFGGGLESKTRREGDNLDVTMRMPDQFYPWIWGSGSLLDWTFGLNCDIPLSLDIKTGASETSIDLTDLQVKDLKLQTGASSTTVTLPVKAGYTRVDIESGVASTNIRLPSGVAARISAHGGLSSINVDTTRFPRQGDLYQSSDYDSASNKVEVKIQTGVGSIDIR